MGVTLEYSIIQTDTDNADKTCIYRDEVISIGFRLVFSTYSIA